MAELREPILGTRPSHRGRSDLVIRISHRPARCEMVAPRLGRSRRAYTGTISAGLTISRRLI